MSLNDIQILGRYPVYGELALQGSKNAVLPLMAASLLHPGVTVLHHVPKITDVECMVRILEGLGAVVHRNGGEMVIDATYLTSCQIAMEDVCKMRSSIMVLGPLVARLGQAVTCYPGGCSIGKRPVDYHIRLLKDFGITVKEENGCIVAKADAYEGTKIHLRFPSVGATENAIMAATGATGATEIFGCAREPEIVELCELLQDMGVAVRGAGSDRIWISGQKKQRDPVHVVRGDRIAAGTYLAAAAVTAGEICIKQAPAGQMKATLEALCACGCQIQTEEDQIYLTGPRHLKTLPFLETAVYPGFPTDMQSILLAVQCCGGGAGVLKENIFEGRFETVGELRKMGAKIQVEDRIAWIHPADGLKGAEVVAHDLRGGAALIVAGLGADGETMVHDCHHVDRGYEDIVTTLQTLGARIYRRSQ